MRRGEPVRNHRFGGAALRNQFKDIQIAGVAGEDRTGRADFVQLLEQLRLQVLLFVDALDDKVGIASRIRNAEAISDVRFNLAISRLCTTSFFTRVSRLA